MRFAWMMGVLAFAGCAGESEIDPLPPMLAWPARPSPPVPRPAPGVRPTPPPPGRASYPWHRNITATVFWVGEAAAPEAGSPTNSASAWDDRWREHFGGVDDPRSRRDGRPAGFTPRENPYYVALPYNDLVGGRRRPDAAAKVPWSRERAWGPRDSMCKNRWVRLCQSGWGFSGDGFDGECKPKPGEWICGGTSGGVGFVYAQWEDAGPFVTDDAAYVFGGTNASPRNARNAAAGIDLSPAVRDALSLTGRGMVDWQFVDERDVPEGPWKRTVTRSGIYWE